MIVKWVCNVWVCLYMYVVPWEREQMKKRKQKYYLMNCSMVFDECANPIKTEMIKAIEQLQQQQNILTIIIYHRSPILYPMQLPTFTRWR